MTAAITAFDKAVAIVLKWEGGYVNDPRDPGGETKYGISKTAYPDLDIASLTEDQAKAIYQRDYWAPVKCDQLPPDLALLVFDCAVNQGPGAAAKLLQTAAGVTADGVIGPQTIAAAQKPGVADAMAVQRSLRYQGNANFSTYGKGWMNRLFDVYHNAVTTMLS